MPFTIISLVPCSIALIVAFGFEKTCAGGLFVDIDQLVSVSLGCILGLLTGLMASLISRRWLLLAILPNLFIPCIAYLIIGVMRSKCP